MAAALRVITTMSNHHFEELSDHQLSNVSGGFLPLLGLIGSLAGPIMNMIGQGKQKKAEKTVQDAQNEQQQALGGQGQGQGGGQGQGQASGGGGGGGAQPARQLTAGMMGERPQQQA